MRRLRDVWERITSLETLHEAARRAMLGKRHAPDALRFWLERERECLRLREELRSRTYRPGPYRTFRIHSPKERMISAAPFRDRVVHHALIDTIGPPLDRSFVFDSYANREGKGTHAAVRRYRTFAARYRYVLQADLRKYFPSIDHRLLLGEIERRFANEGALWLCRVIVDGSNPQERVLAWFPGDDLFAPAERRRGLPIGNLSSQFFALLFLDPIDHFVKETLRVPGYVRYVDDLALFHDDPGFLRDAREALGAALAARRLELHPRKCHIAPTRAPARFLGYRLVAGRVLLPKGNLRRARRRLRQGLALVRAGRLDAASLSSRAHAWLGHARLAASSHLRQRVLRSLAMAEAGQARDSKRAVIGAMARSASESSCGAASRRSAVSPGCT